MELDGLSSQGSWASSPGAASSASTGLLAAVDNGAPLASAAIAAVATTSAPLNGPQPYPLPFAICIGAEPAPGAALQPALLPLPASVDVCVPLPLAQRLAREGSGLRAALSAPGAAAAAAAAATNTPMADVPLVSPAQLAERAAAAAAAGAAHVVLQVPLPPLRALRAADPPRLMVLLRRWRLGGAAGGGVFGGEDPPGNAPSGSGVAGSNSSNGSSSTGSGNGNPQLPGRNGPGPNQSTSNGASVSDCSMTDCDRDNGLPEGQPGGSGGGSGGGGGGGGEGSNPAGAGAGALVVALPLLLLPSPACCAEVQGLLPAALDAARRSAEGGGGGAAAPPPDEGAVFGGRVGPLLFDLSEALAPRITHQQQAAGGSGGGGGGGDLGEYASQVRRLLLFLLAGGMPYCARLLVQAAERAGLVFANRQLVMGAEEVGAAGAAAAAGQGAHAHARQHEQLRPVQEGRADPFATPPAAAPPTRPPRLSWLRAPRGNAAALDSPSTPSTPAAAAAPAERGPPPAPARRPLSASAPAFGGASSSAAATTGSEASAPEAPAAAAAAAAPEPRPADRRGVLGACLWGFADPPAEAAFAIFKSQAVWGLAGPLLASETAAFDAISRAMPHRPRLTAVQLLPVLAYVLLSLLPVQAMLLGALARRGGAWRWAAAQRERLVCAAQAAETLLAVMVVAMWRHMEGLHGVLAAAGAQPSLLLSARQIIKTSALQLSVRRSLFCALLRSLEHAAALSAATDGRQTSADQGAAFAWSALLLSSVVGVAAATAGDYLLRWRWLQLQQDRTQRDAPAATMAGARGVARGPALAPAPGGPHAKEE